MEIRQVSFIQMVTAAHAALFQVIKVLLYDGSARPRTDLKIRSSNHYGQYPNFFAMDVFRIKEEAS